MWTRLQKEELDEITLDPTMLGQLIKLGFGQSTGIDLPGEKQGSIPVSISDNVTRILNSGIDASPIQMLCVFSSVLQGGYRVSPRLVYPGHLESDHKQKQKLFKEKTIEKFVLAIGDDYGPSMASVKKKNYNGKKGMEIIGMGMWPAKSPKISYITVIDNAQIDPRRKRGTLGRTAVIAKKAAFLADVNMLAHQKSRKFQNYLGKPASPTHDYRGQASLMPDLRGRSLRSALEVASSLGLKLKVRGAGIVRKQSPRPGSRLKKGEQCIITCGG
ncbi:MAG: hypothetical protein DSZ23_06305 [Thermodesulfatator sp.]|nr:MAG: hypothetical protein DSZ23_06305 [Thermodesulfatator sp.]